MSSEEVTLKDDERQPCEVWTRVMGYHRPVQSFNPGKQGEHAERRYFHEPHVEAPLVGARDGGKRAGTRPAPTPQAASAAHGSQA